MLIPLIPLRDFGLNRWIQAWDASTESAANTATEPTMNDRPIAISLLRLMFW